MRIILKRATVALLLLCTVCLVVSCGGTGGADDGPSSAQLSPMPYSRNFPYILLGEQYYYCRGPAEKIDQPKIAERVEDKETHIWTVLPEGFIKTNEINNVWLDAPEKDYDMASRYKASGVVYENPQNPEVLYVWFYSVDYRYLDGAFYRFTTDRLGDSDRIAYNNQLYAIPLAEYHTVDVPPSGYSSAGKAIPVSCDVLPVSDLETNWPYAAFDVYANDNAIDRIYIKQESPTQKGVQIEFKECPRISP